MRLRLGFVILALFALSTLMQACSRPLAPQPSCNFVQNPEQQRVAWKGHIPVKLYVHSSVPASANDSIRRAVAEYNQDLGHGTEVFRIESFGVDGPLEPKKDGFSTIYWFNSWDANKPTEQARTTIYWSGSEIFEADIRINALNFTYNFSTDTSFPNVDLTSLLVHELGHALGLAHNPAQGSVMNVTLDNQQVRRKLGQVDLTSLKCEY